MDIRILVVEDEIEIADLLEVFLLNEGYEVHKFYSPIEALKTVSSIEYHCAILDVMMPEIDGFQLCRIIRESYEFPIIMLTAKVEDTDKIIGLTYGADDYITKPFNPLEVNARVKAQLRRYLKFNNHLSMTDDLIEYNGLTMNKQTHECYLYEKKVILTRIEFNILIYLLENKGRIVSAEELFEAVWKEKYLNANNTVMVHIRRIRFKLNELPKQQRFIKTVWGVGYVINK